MLSVKVSTKNQISLPSEARRRLGIAPGDRLSVTIEADRLVLARRAARASDRIRGIAAGSWGDAEPVDAVRRLRRELEA